MEIVVMFKVKSITAIVLAATLVGGPMIISKDAVDASQRKPTLNQIIKGVFKQIFGR